MTKGGTDPASRAEVERVAADHGMTAPSYLDGDGSWMKSAGVRLAPTFMLLDREGRLAYRHAGKLSVGDSAFEEMTAILEKM